jgi:hypothetical protein
VNQPLDPRLQMLLIAIRQALLITAAALAVYCDLEEKQKVMFKASDPAKARRELLDAGSSGKW